MRTTIRIALTVAVLGTAVWSPTLYAQPAGQAGAPAEPQDQRKDETQVALTQTQIDNLIDAQTDVAAAQGGAAADKADSAVDGKVDAAVKKHGFANIDEFANVGYTVGSVMAGIDPETKAYVGTAAVFKKEAAQVKADKAMSAADKKQALDELSAAEKDMQGAKPSAANIALVKTNYDKLSQAIQQSKQQ